MHTLGCGLSLPSWPQLLQFAAGVHRYLTSWFPLDLMTCLPFDLVIALIINSKADYLRLIRMVCRAGSPLSAPLAPRRGRLEPRA